MNARIAINGYGRIGQSVLRAVYERKLRRAGCNLDIAIINELSDIDTISYLTRYDSTHGRFPQAVEVVSDRSLRVSDDLITVCRQESVAELPWSEYEIDLVMECTGLFSARSEADKHIHAGCQKVLLSQPSDTHVDKTIVYGVNHQTLGASDKVVSNASCTTNAIVPVLKILDAEFGVLHGSLTTIHSAMNDQPTIDAYHNQDLRRTRSAMNNMVPVDTQLAKGIERLLPEMKNKLAATAIRIPTLNVSAIDMSVYVDKSVDIEEVNNLLRTSAEADRFNMLAYTEEPIASSDFNHDIHSSIIDGSQTRVSGKRLIKIFTWFDNEWAFANRMLDVAEYWLSLKP